MRYKKIYIEITNVCNLSCHFCAQTNRLKKFMTQEEFNFILDKIKDYTNYIYLHVMGEPLMHPKINEMIELAHSKGFFINLTTNGFLIEQLTTNKVRQINISLHAIKEQNHLSKKEYFNSLFLKCEKLSEKGTYINYRVWRKDCNDILDILEQRYRQKIDKTKKTTTLAKNIFYSNESEFNWPIHKLEKGSIPYFNGTCRALKDHIAILVDGTVIPCCLDNNASIPLGNIYKDSLKTIIHSPLYNELLNGFNNNKKIHPLCSHCDFYSSK